MSLTCSSIPKKHSKQPSTSMPEKICPPQDSSQPVASLKASVSFILRWLPLTNVPATWTDIGKPRQTRDDAAQLSAMAACMVRRRHREEQQNTPDALHGNCCCKVGFAGWLCSDGWSIGWLCWQAGFVGWPCWLLCYDTLLYTIPFRIYQKANNADLFLFSESL